MIIASRHPKSGKVAAFTLVELLLTVSLMLVLVGAVIMNFGSLDRTARLEEGASQVETLFRYSRAQAASTGRQVKIVFGSSAAAGGQLPGTNQDALLNPTNSGVQVLWEPNPVEAPGRFECLPGARQLVEQVNDLVKVQEPMSGCANANDAASPVGSVLPPTASFAGANGFTPADVTSNALPPLTCYPDGSSDSMEVTLAAAGGEDQRLAVVTFSGLTGAARHRFLAPATGGAGPTGERIPADLGRDQ